MRQDVRKPNCGSKSKANLVGSQLNITLTVVRRGFVRPEKTINNKVGHTFAAPFNTAAVDNLDGYSCM
jgi:hypothetical protein